MTIASSTKDGASAVELAIPNGNTVFPSRIGLNHILAHAVYFAMP